MSRHVVDRILGLLKGVKPSGNNWTALCPAHDDHENSLSIPTGDDGKVLLKCHAGCQITDIVAAIGLNMSDLFAARTRCRTTRRCQRPITLQDLGRDKHLPVEFLRNLYVINE